MQSHPGYTELHSQRAFLLSRINTAAPFGVQDELVAFQFYYLPTTGNVKVNANPYFHRLIVGTVSSVPFGFPTAYPS